MQAEIQNRSSYVDSSRERVMEVIAQEKVLKRNEDFKGMDAVREEGKRKFLEVHSGHKRALHMEINYRENKHQ